MKKAIDETKRRRDIQQAYNDQHGITPQTIKKRVRDLISITKTADGEKTDKEIEKDIESMNEKELKKLKAMVEKNMHKAAAELNFEEAAVLRDRLVEINKAIYEGKDKR